MPRAQRSALLDALGIRLAYLLVAVIADLLVPDYDTSGSIDTAKLSGADWLVQRVMSTMTMRRALLTRYLGAAWADALGCCVLSSDRRGILLVLFACQLP